MSAFSPNKEPAFLGLATAELEMIRIEQGQRVMARTVLEDMNLIHPLETEDFMSWATYQQYLEDDQHNVGSGNCENW